ncbi:cell division protein FtsQ [Natronobacillus azotifigens]|uniref:Cell division protein DivIB n=1 Tax=Natronobacillus azotifigens TaxID=472978 RepID=A0A9J6RDB0_9BACI|nr:FtsQ-type POTRA domain-containing protein [Natronobacillus azotifigens]MCZ0703339.1 FtsQ-type POTRA domain-containing protein [Natronobacillus azotifigens]
MSENKRNVISIEDRIPKLKEARKKKTNRRLIFYVFLFFSLISIVIYLQSPLSYVGNIEIIGNRYVSAEEIIKYSKLSSETNIWGVSTEEVSERISQHRELNEVEVSRVFPNTIEIHVSELDKIAYLNNGDNFHPLLENGKKLDALRIVNIQGDAPILYNFTDNEYLIALASELKELSPSIHALISEIYWEPSESNPHQVLLYMIDGHQVETTIRNFANYLSSYPSIASQLDDNQLGVIRIGEGGAVFQSYRPETDEVTEVYEEYQEHEGHDVMNEENEDEIEG